MNKLRLIQAGVGGMGKAWWTGATNASPDFDVVGIVDIADAPLAEAGDALAIPQERRFKSLAAALDTLDADAVLTVTPPAIHVQHAQLAFAHGLHVLTEKPIADTLENAQRMVTMAREAGRQLVVAQNYRFMPHNQTLKRLVAQRVAGELGHGHLDFYIPADFTGTFRETMQFPLLVDMAIHHVDLIRAVTGRNVQRVMAMAFRPAWSWYRHEPGLKMLLELDGDIPFSYSGDWSARGQTTGWSGSWRLQCAQGSIHLENDRVGVARSERWGRNASREEFQNPPQPLSGQARLLHDFAEAIRTGQPAETSGADNLWSFATVIAGVISATKKRTVEVGQLLRA
ncbi:MAG TPA: Gfo/Idh/MocA family oxidoreductase [Tepidisphaeraceae bacterium]|nr:Gfo/Idh/MocA family oxidoreductase [Tepidisphaeraceae bacterium]